MDDIKRDSRRRDPRKRVRAIDLRFDQWVEIMRDAAVTSRRVDAIPLRPERATQTGRIAAGASARDLIDMTLLIEKLRRDLAWNANARAMLELFALKLPYVAGVAA